MFASPSRPNPRGSNAMLHALAVWLGIMLWTFYLAVLIPIAWRFAARHQDAVRDAARRMMRLFGR